MRPYLVLCLLVASLNLTAQYDLGVHFMRGVWQSNYTNPALLPDQRVVLSLPGLKNQFSFDNVTYNDLVVVQPDGTTVLDIDGVIDQLEPDNFIRNDLDVPTVGLAVRLGEGGMLQAGHRLRAGISTRISRDLLALIWRGNAQFIGQEINIGPDLFAQGYHEFYAGGAFTIGDFVTLGGRVKVLNGMGAVESSRSNASLFTSDDVYQSTITADYQLNTTGLVRFDESADGDDVAFAEVQDVFTNNFGFGIDLGLTADLGAITLRASVLDLGSITWRDDVENQIVAGTFTYEGIDVANQPNLDSLDLGTVVDSLDAFFDITTTNARFTTALPPRVFLSGTYQITRDLQLGGLLFGEVFRDRVFPALAVSANWDVAPFFSLGGIYSVRRNSYTNFGAHTALRLGPVQLVAATDNLLTIFRPDDSATAHVRVGLNLAFGRVEGNQRRTSGTNREEDFF
mgnify:CR=1 FL=1